MYRLFLRAVNRPLTTKATAPRLSTTANAFAFQKYAHTATQPAKLDSPDSHNGPASQSQRPPRRRTQADRARGYSLYHPPTNVLVQWLRDRTDPITTDRWTLSRKIAGSKNPRLAVLSLQVVLRQDEARMQTSLTSLLAEPLAWRHRLNRFALKGIHEDDVHHWLWILAPDDTDSKVDRLVAHERFIPIFVLMAILRSDEHMLKGSSLVKVYDYIAKTYISVSPEHRRQWKEELASGIWGRTLDSMGNMAPVAFMVVMGRLIGHCLRTFPSSLPTIAHLVVSYLEQIPDKKPTSSHSLSGYARRCMVFNYAMRNLRRTSKVSPLTHLAHNWKALKVLIGYSAGLKRPLVIDKYSYRAIRIVFLGLQKSEGEKLAASRYAKTWPPYIRQLDGTDEARDKAQYFSRSVKAGILKQSEGYSHGVVDHAIDTLGGALPGRSVTIQTRSTPFTPWTSQYSSLQITAYWAAKVKATRNAYEAWQVFHEPPMVGVKPDFQVYAEMFSKLYAAKIDEESTLLPGDAKETYPPHLANLTVLERERVTPCSAETLYKKMLRSGQRPVHQCLAVLIRNSPSLRRAAQYLDDSPLDRDAVYNMVHSLDPIYQELRRIPLPIFDSYVALLCSQQGRRRWVPNPGHSPQPNALKPYDNIKRAIQLVCARLGPRRRPAMSPWHTIMRALANTRLVMRPYVSQAEDDVLALKTMIDLFNIYIRSQDGTVKRKSIQRQQLAEEMRYQAGIALGMIKSAFGQLIAPVQPPTDGRLSSKDAIPRLHHDLSASNLGSYLKVLVEFGDVEEGVRVIEWILSVSDKSGVLEKARDPRHKQWSMLRNAIVTFRAFVEASALKPETQERFETLFKELEDRGGTWSLLQVSMSNEDE